MNYIINSPLNISCGFEISSNHIQSAVDKTNELLAIIPSSVYKNIDYKTTSSIVGS
jgi:hypothetical protein